MFPIADAQGRIVTYGARALAPGRHAEVPERPRDRHLQEGEDPLRARSREGRASARPGYAILMEGYTDVLMAHLLGFTSAVAGMGTAFTPEQARALHTLHREGGAPLRRRRRGARSRPRSRSTCSSSRASRCGSPSCPRGRTWTRSCSRRGSSASPAILDARGTCSTSSSTCSAKTVDLATPRGEAQAAERLAESVRRVKSTLERDLLVRRDRGPAGRAGRPLPVRAGRGGRPRRARRMPGRVAAGMGASGAAAEGAAGGGAPAGASAAAPVSLEARLKANDGRREQERLVAGALFRPELFARVRADLPVGEIADPGLATVWREMLAVNDSGEGLTVEVARPPDRGRSGGRLGPRRAARRPALRGLGPGCPPAPGRHPGPRGPAAGGPASLRDLLHLHRKMLRPAPPPDLRP